MPLNRVQLSANDDGNNPWTFPLNPNEYYPIDSEEYNKLETLDGESIYQKPIFDTRQRRMIWFNLRVSVWKTILVSELKSRLFAGSNYYYIRDRDLDYLPDWTRIKIIDVITEVRSGAGPLTYSRVELIYEYAVAQDYSLIEIGLNDEAQWHPTWGYQSQYFSHWRNECNLNFLQYTALRNFTDDPGAPAIDLDDVAAVVNAAVSAGFTPVVRVGGWTDGERDNPLVNPWDDAWIAGWNVDAVSSTALALTKMPGVRYWQIDNEPQGIFFGHYASSYTYTTANWNRYHELLKRQAAAIMAANSANIVISPGLAGGQSLTDSVQDIQDWWLESYFRLLTVGGEIPPFSILAFHLWSESWDTPYQNRWRQPYRGIGHRIRTFRSLIDEYGFDINEIWTTEAAKEIVRAGAGFSTYRSPEDQQRFLIDSVAEFRECGERVKYFWFSFRNTYAAGPYALVFPDTGPNLAYYTWRDYCNEYND